MNLRSSTLSNTPWGTCSSCKGHYSKLASQINRNPVYIRALDCLGIIRGLGSQTSDPKQRLRSLLSACLLPGYRVSGRGSWEPLQTSFGLGPRSEKREIFECSIGAVFVVLCDRVPVELFITLLTKRTPEWTKPIHFMPSKAHLQSPTKFFIFQSLATIEVVKRKWAIKVKFGVKLSLRRA